MKHKLLGNFKTKEVYLNDKKLLIKPSLKIKEYSIHFDWGDASKNKGILQIALAIIATLTGSYEGYHKLKHEIIDKIPKGDFYIEFEIPWKDIEMQTRELAILNAKAHHKNIPKEVFKEKSNEELICWTHPLEREQFAKALNV